MKKDEPTLLTDSLRSPPDIPARETPLPWQSPKSNADDPQAAARIKAILESPQYIQADEDIGFLQSERLRSVRLQLDFMKAEEVLSEHGIEHTIIVFGSTRIPEPAVAHRAEQEARHRLAKSPQDPALIRAHRTAKRIVQKSSYYDIARNFAASLCGSLNAQDGKSIAIMTGGGPGLMEAANRGACEVDTKSIGLNITLPHEQYPNPYLTPGLCLRFHYFALRKMHFLLRARALVAFPGGYGTLDELFETLTLVQTRKIAPLPIILVGPEFWKRAIDFPFLVDEGVIDPEDERLFRYAETAAEIRDHIVNWYAASGQPLFKDTKSG